MKDQIIEKFIRQQMIEPKRDNAEIIEKLKEAAQRYGSKLYYSFFKKTDDQGGVTIITALNSLGSKIILQNYPGIYLDVDGEFDGPQLKLTGTWWDIQENHLFEYFYTINSKHFSQDGEHSNEVTKLLMTGAIAIVRRNMTRDFVDYFVLDAFLDEAKSTSQKRIEEIMSQKGNLIEYISRLRAGFDKYGVAWSKIQAKYQLVNDDIPAKILALIDGDLESLYSGTSKDELFQSNPQTIVYFEPPQYVAREELLARIRVYRQGDTNQRKAYEKAKAGKNVGKLDDLKLGHLLSKCELFYKQLLAQEEVRKSNPDEK